ncbi:MAG: phenylacetate--CoA ligase family protein [Kiritimatiellia bacterium]|jgi:phenylacetate-CoA ligase
MKFYNPKAETLSRDELTALQNERLKKIVRHAAENSPYFRKKFAIAGVDPQDFRGLDDLHQLPFMSKADFREQYPLGMSCVDKRSLAEMHMSSGSTGTPVVMPYTQADLDQWAETMARCYVMAGAVKGDVCQITPGFGLFNGGFGCYHGARAAGLFVLPCGAGNTTRQIKLAQDFETRVITGVVSYAIRIMEILGEQKQKLPSLEIGIFGAETFSNEMRDRIRSGLGIEVFDIYGMTETGGIGTLGMDCPDHSGIHVWDDHVITEIVDPATGEPVPDGEYGEVVVTTLTREALPVIRFRTGDRSRIVSRAACACGRTHTRLDKITGRLDDMMIVSGVNFFPQQVEQSLLKVPGVLPNYRMIIENHHGIKRLHVDVEAEPGVTGFMVEKQLREDLGFSPDGDIHPAGSLPRPEGKAKRVFYEDRS